MKTQQNGPMSHEQVRKIFCDLRSQLDKLEELFLEVAVMLNARWGKIYTLDGQRIQ